MFAIRQYELGPPETLQYESVPDPVAGKGRLRIAVTAAGVHAVDAVIRTGAGSGPFAPPELPMTPGREVAGVVDQVGEDVDESWLGKRVVAHLGMASGGYAEKAVREVEAVHEIPEGVDDAEAVAMIGTGRTAVGILDNTPISADDVVVVTAAAGGIGNLLVQAARAVGATVVGLAGGPAKVDQVRALASEVIAVDYRAEGWPQLVRDELAGREATLVYDGVGGEPGRAAFDLLGIGGKLIMFGWSAGEPIQLSATDLFERYLTASVVLGPTILKRPGGIRALETEALRQVAQRRMVPITQSFPMSEAGNAQHALETRETVGKVVLIP